MPDTPIEVRRGPGLVFLLPLVSLVLVEAYARKFDGWGAWSTGPLFLLPLILSVVFSTAGVVHCIAELRKGLFRPSSLVAVAVALVPAAWLLVRRQFV